MPKLVVLCGSSRFCQEMAVCAWFLERDEGAVTLGLHLLPWWYESASHHIAEYEGVADKMDALHLSKIDLIPEHKDGGEVFVVNKGDYIGESTRREIEYAKSKGIPIRWYTHDPIGRRVEFIHEDAMGEVLGEEPDEVTFLVCLRCGHDLQTNVVPKHCPKCGTKEDGVSGDFSIRIRTEEDTG